MHDREFGPNNNVAVGRAVHNFLPSEGSLRSLFSLFPRCTPSPGYPKQGSEHYQQIASHEGQGQDLACIYVTFSKDSRGGCVVIPTPPRGKDMTMDDKIMPNSLEYSCLGYFRINRTHLNSHYSHADKWLKSRKRS